MKNLVRLPAEFDYNLLTGALKDYKKPRDKIRSLVQNKDIIRVKKGLYVLGKEYGKPYNKYVLANLIYGPSYVTGQTALSFWNMIPERVELLISMSYRKSLCSVYGGPGSMRKPLFTGEALCVFYTGWTGFPRTLIFH